MRIEMQKMKRENEPTRRWLRGAVGAALAALLGSLPATAQVVRDDTPGQTAGLVPQIGTEFQIRGGDGIRTGDANSIVFHSFSDFDLTGGASARYTDDANSLSSVQNVITRITGGSPSTIDGRISSDYLAADFYFVNPNGVLFGDNAVLDINGSFHVSTADVLEWGAGNDIRTGVPEAVPLLTAPRATAWGFLSAGPEKALTVGKLGIVDSGVDVAGQSISFVGAGVDLGSIEPTNSRHVLAVSIGAPGTVARFAGLDDPASQIPSVSSFGDLRLGGDISTAGGGRTAGDIVLVGGDVEVRGELIASFEPDGLAGDGGDITIFASGDITGSPFLDASSIDGVAGTINLFSINGSIVFESFTARSVARRVLSDASAGTVALTASQDLFIENPAFIEVGDGTPGVEAGTIGLTASAGTLQLLRPTLLAESFDGDGGTISLQGDTIYLQGGRPVSARARGDGVGGDILIAGTDVFLTNVLLDAGSATGTPGQVATSVSNSFTIDIDVVFDPAPPFTAGVEPTLGTIPAPFPVPDVGSPFPPDPPDPPDPPGPGSLSPGELEQAGGAVLGQYAPHGTVQADVPAALDAPGTAGTAAADGDGDAEDSEEKVAEATAEQRREAVAAAEEAAEEESGRPAVALFTRSDDEAPSVPRTCAVHAKERSDSRLFARTGRGVRVSPEEWLVALDTGGDTLLAAAASDTPPVSLAAGTAGPDGTLQRTLVRAAEARRNGRLDEAAEAWNEVVEGLLAAGDRERASDALRALAETLMADGRYEAARRPLERAVAEAEAQGDTRRSAAARAALGNALVGLGDLEGAGEALTRGIGFVQKSDDPQPAAGMLHNLGNRNAAQGDFEAAIWAYGEAATLAKERGLTLDEARALAGGARAAVDAGRAAAAKPLLFEAGLLVESLPRSEERVALLLHLGRSHLEIGRRSPAERSSALLNAHAAFDRATVDATALDHARYLALARLGMAELYREEQHRSEALYLVRRARQALEGRDAADIEYRTHWLEGGMLWAAHRAQPALAAHRRAVAILEEARGLASQGYGTAQTRFRSAVAPVYLDTVDVLLHSAGLSRDPARSQELLVEATETLERLKAAELRNYFEDECIADVRGHGRGIQSLEPGAAVVYTVSLPDRLELLLGSAEGVERFTVPVARRQLGRVTERFREHVQDPYSSRYRAPGRQLHEWLVAPYEERLAEAGIDTLVFVPDGVLRTLPFAALRADGPFLGERFAIATAVSLRLLARPSLGSAGGPPLLAGVSEGVQGFSPLEAVPQELEGIRAIEGGELLLDDAFTLDRVRGAVASDAPHVVHLATHAVFTGNPDTSFLLTHAGRVGFDDLSDIVGMTRFDGRPIELLVLSACETAVGNDRAGLGFTGSAIRAGARSALGSLWPIADEATKELMVRFYEALRQEGTSKARALQTAQASVRGRERFEHPYYWAPFTLVNDWL